MTNLDYSQQQFIACKAAIIQGIVGADPNRGKGFPDNYKLIVPLWFIQKNRPKPFETPQPQSFTALKEEDQSTIMTWYADPCYDLEGEFEFIGQALEKWFEEKDDHDRKERFTIIRKWLNYLANELS